MNRRYVLKSSLILTLASTVRKASFGNIILPNGVIQNPGFVPFKINYGKGKIKDLHKRIDDMIWPEMPFDTGWHAGTNDKVLKDMVKYWRYEYDWFKEQDKLNQLSNFKMPIEGEMMHFIRYKGTGQRQKFPLLLLHGWPSSFLEFSEACLLMVKGINGQPGFDLITPSLPGFIFSDVPKAAGLHPGRIAKRMHFMMGQLGYEKYGVVGLDWGAVIGRELARQFPNAIVGFHRTSIPYTRPATNKVLNDSEKQWLNLRDQLTNEGMAYAAIQSTKPQSLAYGLQDSPVGLLAWILDKYWSWSDHGEDLWQTFDRNKILTTVMLYWLTGKVLPSARIYYENKNTPEAEKNNQPPVVPVALARAPKDPFDGAPLSFLNLKDFPSTIQTTELAKGGHFPAMEQPILWSNDVTSFFSKL